jgi:Flp pilus assembly pilin Flp
MKEYLLLYYLKSTGAIKRALKEQDGITTMELGIVAAILVLTAIGIMTTFSDALTQYWESIRTKFMSTRPTP